MRKQAKTGEGMGSEAARRLGAGVRALSRLRRSLAGQNRHVTQATLAGKEAGGSYPAKIDLSTPPPPAPPQKKQKQNKANSVYKHPVEFQKLNIKLKNSKRAEDDGR